MTQLYRAGIDICQKYSKNFEKLKKWLRSQKMTFYQNNILTQLKIEMTLHLFKLD